MARDEAEEAVADGCELPAALDSGQAGSPAELIEGHVEKRIEIT